VNRDRAKERREEIVFFFLIFDFLWVTHCVG